MCLSDLTIYLLLIDFPYLPVFLLLCCFVPYRYFSKLYVKILSILIPFKELFHVTGSAINVHHQISNNSCEHGDLLPSLTVQVLTLSEDFMLG